MCNVEGPPLKKRKPQPLAAAEPLPVYLDYNATTPLCEEAWAAMSAVHNVWGNPSSSHPYGLEAKYYLEAARAQVCAALGAPTNDSVVFTSGGTESNNMAIVGGALAVHAVHPSRCLVVSTTVEHPAVEEVLKNFRVTASGAQLEFKLVPVSATTGCLDPDLLREALLALPGGPRTVAVVTVMTANNELGSVNPIPDLVRIVKELCGPECLFHTDAAQALGKVPVNVVASNVDLLSVCGHKFYAPKGSGALYVRPGVTLQKILFGAGHERGMRPGTENVLFATGMAAALALACNGLPEYGAHMRETRDELARVLRLELQQHDMDYEVNGDLSTSLPNTLNCAVFKKVRDDAAGLPCTYISAARLILTIGDQVCISAGSACHSTSDADVEIEVSTPLKAVGVNIHRAIGTLRLSTGRYTTIAEVRRAARIIARQAAHQFSA